MSGREQRLSAAEAYLALLDDLAGTKPNGATAAVLLKHAAEHIRSLLDELKNVPRPGGSDGRNAEASSLATMLDGRAGPGHSDLSHLPLKAGPLDDMCEADSPRDGADSYWTCNARRGHPERWHAAHGGPDDQPWAAIYPDAAWPVAERERGLPVWAAGSLNPALPVRVCGATEGQWACNAVPRHEPLDHVAFGAWGSRMPGAVLARWASVRPSGSAWADQAEREELERQGLPEDVRREGMGAQGEPATGLATPEPNTLPPRTEVPRPEVSHRIESAPTTQPGLPRPGHLNGHAKLPEPVIDPDCRDGKHGSCVGGPCQCDCHAPADPFQLAAAEGGDT